MAQQTIVLHFDSRSDAQKARDALVQAGIGLSSIRMLPEAETTSYTRSSTTTAYDHGKDRVGSGPRSATCSCRTRTATPTRRA
jgi:hypothetical protein